MAAQLLLSISASKLIHVPAAPLANGIALPNFQGILHDQGLWLPLLWIVITLLLIDGTESLATIAAVDRIDPWRRKSDPDTTLLSMGACNVCSSLLGGLTIIPGIVKSTANILGGGRTQWANFFNACFLLVFLTAGREWINLVPKSVLASILLFIGFKLCRPKVWLETARVGWEQFVIFAVTVLVTVTTDLLIGIAAGVAVKCLLTLWSHTLALAWNATAEDDESQKPTAQWGLAFELLRNPVTRREHVDGIYHLYCDRPLCCFNLFHVLREMDAIPSDAREIVMHLSEGVTLIDHTTCEILFHYLEEHNNHDEKPSLEIEGFDRMRSLSGHESSMRLAIPTVNSE
jgi:MFS superfamily sulfate permease-like transporter